MLSWINVLQSRWVVLQLNFINKNFIYLLTGSVGVMPVMLLLNIVLARELGPVKYGDYTYLLSIITLFTTVFTFGFFQAGGRALVLNSSNKRRLQYYGAELVILVLLYLLLNLALILFVQFDSNIKEKGLLDYFSILLMCSWVFLFKRYCEVLFQADGRVKLLSFSKIFQPLLYLILVVLLILVGGGLSLYIVLVVFIASNILSVFFILYVIQPKFDMLLNRLNEIWLYNKKFGFHLYLGSVLPLSMSMLSMILISYHSEDNAGLAFYSIALSLTALITVIPNTMATVHYRGFSKSKVLPLRLAAKTFLLTFLAAVVLIVCVQKFVQIVYGVDYALVYKLVYILSCGMLAHGFGDFLNRYLSAKGYGKYVRNASVLTGLFLLSSSLMLIPTYQEYGAAISTSLTGFAYFLILFFYYRKVVNE